MSRRDERIFLLSDEGQLERVPRADYDTEDLLQSLLDNHPDLLAGDQMQPEGPVRWLVVAREAGIPDASGGSDRWSVDHLVLDQDARPTFVEVKRSTDARIRREVVGQLLDYAANAQQYWPVDRIRTMAAERYGGVDGLAEELRRLLLVQAPDDEDRLESFWSDVEENLRNGNVRLLFVADELPKELRRIIEFLNEQMPRVEVLGVEVRQFVGENIRALVPRLVGQTEFARQNKRSTRTQSRTDRQTFLGRCAGSETAFFEELLDQAESKGLAIYWGVKGFTVRVPRPSGDVCSLVYGVPRDLEGGNTALLQPYLGSLSSEDDAEGIRARFLAAAPFAEKGRYTLELQLLEENMLAAQRAVSVTFEIAEELMKGAI